MPRNLITELKSWQMEDKESFYCMILSLIDF